MQLTGAEVIPVGLNLKVPVNIAGKPTINSVSAIFIRIDTIEGQTAWGCTIAHPALNGETPEEVIQLCRECCNLIPDLHPTNIEYSLAELAQYTRFSPAAACAFDLVFHDLLGLATGLPLHRLLGGYRSRIPMSITIPLGGVEEAVETARKFADSGFRHLKIKGGTDPELDIQRVQAVHRAIPSLALNLDVEGAYDIRQALEIARILEGRLEVLEQPTPPADYRALSQITRQSQVRVLADQSLTGPDSALKLCAEHAADGLTIKLASCGGLGPARQINLIAQAAGIPTMAGSVIEPALLTAAGLSFALGSPNVQYCDLDGYLLLEEDPTVYGFTLDEGCLIASDTPGLGCSVDL